MLAQGCWPRKAGVEIPHYCWHEALSVVASCRMCLIEVGETKPDGSVVMGGKLVPACQTPVKPGMVIKTETAKVTTAQAMTLETTRPLAQATRSTRVSGS